MKFVSQLSMRCAVATMFLAVSLAAAGAADSTVKVSVDAAATGKPVPSTLHGIFFEDINYGADGGLYAELVQNRSFEHRDRLYGWKLNRADEKVGGVEISDDAPLNENNQHFARVTRSADQGQMSLVNNGFDGIALKRGESYLVSFYARSQAPDAGVGILLQDASGKSVAEHRVNRLTPEWKMYEAELPCNESAAEGRLAVAVENAGTVDIDMVSLFPKHTFKNRRNGLRRDLAQALADLRPGFFRFPGGCIVEGVDLDNAYRWKDTIGDVAERKQNWNLWQNRESPQYSQTYGLGFFEYFQFCEDIGAAAVPVVNCGMSCQARRRGKHVPLEELGPWIQDALDLIEFANGPTTSTWGAKRTAMGHAEPFGLKFLAVGNEQWNDEYFARYTLFEKAIKEAHPEIQVISSSGPFAEDNLWKFAWDKFRGGTRADIVDEHYYVQPRWLLQNTERYASYDPRGPKVFVGEFAAHDANRRNNLRAALAEAAYMTSLVRHSDIVCMASYAPLLAKFDHQQWQPNLIWFDNEQVVLTPSYHAQALFAQNRPDQVLPIDVAAPQLALQPKGMIGVGTWNTQAEYRNIQVAHPSGQVLYASNFDDGLSGWNTAGGDWSVKDGALQQTAGGPNVRAVTGDPTWTDYTLTLQARKIGGDEGFLILFHSPNLEAPAWWNLGGWNNTEHAIQNADVPERRLPGKIETGRWYDIRIELAGPNIKAYLDGKLIEEATVEPTAALYAAAGRDEASGELVLQLVNPFDEPRTASIELAGLPDKPVRGRIISLRAADPAAENTRDEPNHVAPRIDEFIKASAVFEHTVPANSIQILRLSPAQE